MRDRVISANPRLDTLRPEVEEKVLNPFRWHGWSAEIVREIDRDSCIKIAARRDTVTTRIAVLYSSSENSDARYKELSKDVDRIFFRGEPYYLDSYARGVTVPVQPLREFFPFLVNLNKRLEPDCSQPANSRRPPKILRLTAENPLDAVIARLQQFTSTTLARKLVERRAKTESTPLEAEVICSKANGIAYVMRGALDYIVSTPRDALNKRVLGLYYGAMALAQAEMLASPSGPTDLDQVEGMTLRGHGLYVLPDPPCTPCGFAGIRVGVWARGFFPEWLKVLGHDTSGYPTNKLKPKDGLKEGQTNMVCSLRDLFASMPEIADLFAEVFGGPPGWVSVVHDLQANGGMSVLDAKSEKVGSTYVQFIDHSGKVSVEMLKNAGWPLAEIRQVEDHEDTGTALRGRVDHAGHDLFWTVLPTFTSPFVNSSPLLLFPTVGGIQQYRTIAMVTLYALSIMVRYMPSKWRRIEGGDEDQYLALVQASLAVWERLLPEHFLESIAGETVRTAQPGSWVA